MPSLYICMNSMVVILLYNSTNNNVKCQYLAINIGKWRQHTIIVFVHVRLVNAQTFNYWDAAANIGTIWHSFPDNTNK